MVLTLLPHHGVVVAAIPPSMLALAAAVVISIRHVGVSCCRCHQRSPRWRLADAVTVLHVGIGGCRCFISKRGGVVMRCSGHGGGHGVGGGRGMPWWRGEGDMVMVVVAMVVSSLLPS